MALDTIQAHLKNTMMVQNIIQTQENIQVNFLYTKQKLEILIKFCFKI